MKQSPFQPLVQDFIGRRLVDGGFAPRPGATSRPDTTAWAVLALQSAGASSPVIEAARARLMADQSPDGRVSMAPDQQDAFWPTPLALMAWHGAESCRSAAARAVDFLLATTGLHWPRSPGDAYSHDPSIRGWPWVANTHSWVAPTSMALLALDLAGYSGHARFQEGVRLLVDRQLPGGGWNMGNTAVYGQELRPTPNDTGVALAALAGHLPRDRVQPSIAYLRKRIATLRAPLSLGWGVLGLGAWGERPAAARAWIRESLDREAESGSCDTHLLALLILADRAREGLTQIIAGGGTDHGEG